MNRRNDRGPLRDMRDYARQAVNMFEAASADELEGDRKLHLALSHLVQIVGEAATRVSDTTRKAHPEIRWRDIIDMRNRLLYSHDQVQRERLHHTIAVDVPKLIGQLTAILGEE